ncbi:MAG TPA: aldolase/citrate lyase family protein [Azospirillaceae bacterium]|nr:aldolase/citrate lyase family protein [Azospirillaceae bacterium]
MLKEQGFWMSTPSPMFAEMAAAQGFGRVVLDVEHGAFDLGDLDRFIPFCRALGLQVLAKVLAPEQAPIQQALDFGADGVVIPHVGDSRHAERVCAYAKYPPLGGRSFAGGRVVRYGGIPEGFFAAENRRVLCLPMVESAEALADIDAILALPAVDGVFLGPTDLALSRGRPTYGFGAADREDIGAVAAAARRAGKPWVMPAWSAAERAFSRTHGAAWMVTLDEQGAALSGMRAAAAELVGEMAAGQRGAA